jgi:hypothetical protein
MAAVQPGALAPGPDVTNEQTNKIILFQDNLTEWQKTRGILIWKATPYILAKMYNLFRISTSVQRACRLLHLKDVERA